MKPQNKKDNVMACAAQKKTEQKPDHCCFGALDSAYLLEVQPQREAGRPRV